MNGGRQYNKCMAHHGKDYDEVLMNVKQVIELWVETAKEFGDPIPQPKGRLMFA